MATIEFFCRKNLFSLKCIQYLKDDKGIVIEVEGERVDEREEEEELTLFDVCKNVLVWSSS